LIGIFSDEVKVSPELLPDYEEKIAYFFEEHLHTDDEVRYIIDGLLLNLNAVTIFI
jgi:1,2-dihydroxy-3-keto-5-methylthiopentene dioxygenase